MLSNLGEDPDNKFWVVAANQPHIAPRLIGGERLTR